MLSNICLSNEPVEKKAAHIENVVSNNAAGTIIRIAELLARSRELVLLFIDSCYFF
jgi:hypothetical protein